MAYIEERQRVGGTVYRAVVQLDGRKMSKTFAYAHEAQRWADDIEQGPEAPYVAPTAASEAPSGSGVTVAQHAEAWLSRLPGVVRPETLVNYRTMVRAIVAEPRFRVPLDDLRKSHVEAWVSQLSTQSPLGASSIRLRVKVLRMVLRDAMAERLTDRDVTEGVRLPARAITVDRVLTDAEDAALMEAIDDAKTRALVLLALDAGLRWGEASGIAADAVDLDAGYLIVRQTNGRHEGIVAATKSGQTRTVPIFTERLRDALAAVMPAEGLLFPNEAGGPHDYHGWMARTYRPLMRRAKVKGVTFHKLRHTCATRLTEGNMTRSAVAALLGHADPRTTDRYIHVGEVDSLMAEARGAMAERARRAALHAV